MSIKPFKNTDRLYMNEVIKEDLKNNESFIYYAGNGNFLIGGNPQDLLVLASQLIEYLSNTFVKELVEGITNGKNKKSV